MVSCIFLLFGSYFKLFYLPWTAQEELCCALSSADSGKCQLCCSSVSNMFLERFKNSTVWNISISSLVDENWGGVNSFLLHWSKKSCSVQVLWAEASYWCWRGSTVRAPGQSLSYRRSLLLSELPADLAHVAAVAVQDTAGQDIQLLTCLCCFYSLLGELLSVYCSNTPKRPNVSWEHLPGILLSPIVPFHFYSAGAPHHWLLGLCLVFIGIS